MRQFARNLKEIIILDYKPENIVVSTGAKQSLANAILALVDVGDEVIIPAPFWVTYSELVKIAGGVPVIVRSAIENKYKITAQQLEESITERSKVFLFSSPCNPKRLSIFKRRIESNWLLSWKIILAFQSFPMKYMST